MWRGLPLLLALAAGAGGGGGSTQIDHAPPEINHTPDARLKCRTSGNKYYALDEYKLVTCAKCYR